MDIVQLHAEALKRSESVARLDGREPSDHRRKT
jgi:hypothetical protein